MEDKNLDDLMEVKTADSAQGDKSFDDSELEDIMSEIEGLEKEFSVDESSEERSLSDLDESDFEGLDGEDSEISEPVVQAKEEETIEDDIEEAQKEASSEENIFHLEKGAHMKNSLECSGEMEVSLKVGEAQVSLDKEGKLEIVYGGVRISVDQNEGCHLEMDGGVDLKIPLHSADVSKAS